MSAEVKELRPVTDPSKFENVEHVNVDKTVDAIKK